MKPEGLWVMIEERFYHIDLSGGKLTMLVILQEIKAAVGHVRAFPHNLNLYKTSKINYKSDHWVSKEFQCQFITLFVFVCCLNFVPILNRTVDVFTISRLQNYSTKRNLEPQSLTFTVHHFKICWIIFELKRDHNTELSIPLVPVQEHSNPVPVSNQSTSIPSQLQ